MGIRFVIDLACGCVVTRVSGSVSAADVHEYLRALRAHPDFNPDHPRLVDIRRITRMPTSAEMRMVAQTVWEREKGYGRRALVADRDYPFGLLRMFEIIAGIHSHTTEYRAFRDLPSAAEWLGLDPAVISSLEDANDVGDSPL